MGAVCKDCRHFKNGLFNPYCCHPNAMTINRIWGPEPSSLDLDHRPETIAKCDAEGWFDKPRPWWMF
jgi:hypothetical protein